MLEPSSELLSLVDKVRFEKGALLARTDRGILPRPVSLATIASTSSAASPGIRVDRGKGALAFAPVVDPNGYTFPLRAGNELVGLDRFSLLPVKAGVWADLLGCL
jgi:hypothetical protein